MEGGSGCWWRDTLHKCPLELRSASSATCRAGVSTQVGKRLRDRHRTTSWRRKVSPLSAGDQSRNGADVRACILPGSPASPAAPTSRPATPARETPQQPHGQCRPGLSADCDKNAKPPARWRKRLWFLVARASQPLIHSSWPDANAPVLDHAAGDAALTQFDCIQPMVTSSATCVATNAAEVAHRCNQYCGFVGNPSG
jgi:hypothetical protein